MEVSALSNLNMYGPFVEIARIIMADPHLEAAEKFPLPEITFVPTSQQTQRPEINLAVDNSATTPVQTSDAQQTNQPSSIFGTCPTFSFGSSTNQNQ